MALKEVGRIKPIGADQARMRGVEFTNEDVNQCHVLPYRRLTAGYDLHGNED